MDDYNVMDFTPSLMSLFLEMVHAEVKSGGFYCVCVKFICVVEEILHTLGSFKTLCAKWNKIVCHKYIRICS
jgi:hypothetical protein